MKKFLIVCIVGMFLTALPAFATTITQTQNFSGIPNISGSLTFNQFNDNAGTLTLQSIEVQFYLETDGGHLIIDNDGVLPASGTFQFGAVGIMSSTDVILLNSLFLPIPGQVGAYHSQVFNLSADNGDGPGNYDPTPPDGLSYDGGIESDSKSDFVGNAFWGVGTKGFLGTGIYDINYSIIQWLNCGGISGIEYAITPVNITGHVTINYTYIPEPATIVLLMVSTLVFTNKKI
jgi:hypothetical protein